MRKQEIIEKLLEISIKLSDAKIDIMKLEMKVARLQDKKCAEPTEKYTCSGFDSALYFEKLVKLYIHDLEMKNKNIRGLQ